MKKIMSIFSMLFIIYLVLSNLAVAGTTSEEHEKANMDVPGKMGHVGSSDVFKKIVVTNHIQAEFQIMSLASMNMKDPNGASHHVMVKLLDNSDNQQVKEAVGKIKVIGPDKTEQINSLKNYSGIFTANFSFDQTGKYGIICLAKIHGKKYLFKFWYPHK
jgi:hypothetical protein